MNSIAEHNGSAEREPRLRTVPLHEFFNGVPVTALRVCRGQAVQNGGFCLIQIGKRRTALGLERVRFQVGFRDIVRGPPSDRATMVCLPNHFTDCPSERSRWRGGRCRVGDVGSPDFRLR